MRQFLSQSLCSGRRARALGARAFPTRGESQARPVWVSMYSFPTNRVESDPCPRAVRNGMLLSSLAASGYMMECRLRARTYSAFGAPSRIAGVTYKSSAPCISQPGFRLRAFSARGFESHPDPLAN